jgi:hypothetical protein
MNFECWAAGTWAAGSWVIGSWCPGAATSAGNIVMRRVYETYNVRRPVEFVDEEEEALILAIMETLLHGDL